MKGPDYLAAERYVLQRLERELPASVTYHSINHTRDDVATAAVRLAEMEGLDPETTFLLRTAAIYHDIGYLEQPDDHERASMRIAGEVLPQFGYSPQQVERIQAMIMATKLPQSPKNRAEEVLADADLDILGREDFFTQSYGLRDELASGGQEISLAEWYARQLKFLQNHHYWTASAHQLRDAGKQKNIQALEKLLQENRDKTQA